MASSSWRIPTTRASRANRGDPAGTRSRQVDRHGHSVPQEYDAKRNLDFLLEKGRRRKVYLKTGAEVFFARSRAVAELLGAKNVRHIGKSDFDFWAMETARDAAADEQRIMNTREPLVGKIEKLVHRDGRVSWDHTTELRFWMPTGRSSESAE